MRTTTGTDTDKILSGCVCGIVLMLTSPLSIIWKGYVFSVLWRWFVVPTFDARPLGIAASIGLIYVASMLTYHYRRAPKDERPLHEQLVESLCFALFGPALMLGLAAIVHHWM